MTRNRGSVTAVRKKSTNWPLVSKAIKVASGRMCLRISVVKLPTPGPYSTMSLASCQSICRSTLATRKGELGRNQPSILVCLRKFRANSNVPRCEDLVCFGMLWGVLFCTHILDFVSEPTVNFVLTLAHVSPSTWAKSNQLQKARAIPREAPYAEWRQLRLFFRPLFHFSANSLHRVKFLHSPRMHPSLLARYPLYRLHLCACHPRRCARAARISSPSASSFSLTPTCRRGSPGMRLH